MIPPRRVYGHITGGMVTSPKDMQPDTLKAGTPMATSQPNVAEGEATKKLVQFVVQQIRKGSDKWTISGQLTDSGMDRADSDRFVDAVYAEVMKTAVLEQPTAGSFVWGLAGGLIAALIGGMAWGLIVKWTDYEIGFMAWGLGLLAGFIVVRFSRGKKGVLLQLIAVLSSILGIAVGKYFIFGHALRQVVLQQYGPESAAKVSVLSEKVFAFFLQSLPKMTSGYDALWVVLAVITAWRIPKALGIKVPDQPIHE